MKRAAFAVAAVVITLTVALPLGVMSLAEQDISPSSRAIKEIPMDLLPLYRRAAASCPGLRWSLLAAIHKVETSFGRGSVISSKGAQGPMQFLPSTFKAHGVDGDGDGRLEINDVDDAVFSAAHLLCANGAGDPARLVAALWSYNHSDEYVAEVLTLASAYEAVNRSGMAGSAAGLLRHPNVLLTANARADLRAGLVDKRLLAVLNLLAYRHSLGITVFKTGHAIRTNSGDISNHFYGRGVDIFFVDGAPVSDGNLGARNIVQLLSRLDEPLRPSEIGHPFGELPVAGGFSDSDHRDHIHIAFD